MENLTLVIPAKYESTSLPHVLGEIEKMDLKCKKIEVVPSYDEETINAIKHFDCEIIFQNSEGFGNAIIQGLSMSKTEISCIFNADGSFDPKYLEAMIEKIRGGYDFIFSSRYTKHGGSEDDTIVTLIGNYFFTYFCKILFKLNISDVLYTYVMGRTSAFKDLNLKNNDFTFCIELPVKAKFRSFKMMDFPSFERSRISGKKKVNELKDGFLILMSILKMFINKI